MFPKPKQTLPKLKSSYELRPCDEEFIFKLKIWPNADSEKASTFTRGDDRRWRCNGPFASVADIVSQLFEYERPTSLEDIELMESFVIALGDAIDMCDAMVSERWQRHQEREQEKRRKEIEEYWKTSSSIVEEEINPKTYIYLMTHKNGLTKIGHSKRPKAREKTLQAEDPRLNLIHSKEGTIADESRLHRIFDSVRVRGEWFDLSSHHIDWISNITFAKQEVYSND